MPEIPPARAIELLGQFNDQLTWVIDDVYGTHWAEIEEILAIVALADAGHASTRDLSERSELGRRAVTRLVTRLASADLVRTRPSASDARVVEVVLTDAGTERVEHLRERISALFTDSKDVAREIAEGLGDQRDDTTAPFVETDPLDLLWRVCDAGAALVRYMPPAATHGKLAARQRAALVFIASQSGIRPNDLIGPLEVSPAGVAYIVDQLSTKGFIRRRRGVVPGDRRAVVLEATDEGFQAVAAVAGGIEQERGRLVDLFAEIAWRSEGR